jgi:hypothetical protein
MRSRIDVGIRYQEFIHKEIFFSASNPTTFQNDKPEAPSLDVINVKIS